MCAFADVRQESRQRLVTAWQNYCETGDELDPTSPMKRTMRMSSVDDEDLLPLPDNALTNNLGLDLVVVVTKVGLVLFCVRVNNAMTMISQQTKIRPIRPIT